MAETPLKRLREEVEIEDSKKHKSFSQIISLLEGDVVEDETTQDLTSLITTLQQEISSEEDPVQVFNKENYNFTTLDFSFSSTEDLDSFSSPSSSVNPSKSDDDEEEKERVMKHLLEASDDELGIPNTVAAGGELGGGGGGGGGQDDYPLWELEDDAATYYTLLQSDLFM